MVDTLSAADTAGETEKTPSFAAYIVLSEAIEFNSTEIEEALLEDYPSLDLHLNPGLRMPKDCNTAEFITTFICLGSTGRDGVSGASLIRLPGYGTWDPAKIAPHQMIGCHDIKERLTRNASYICVDVGARSSDAADLFRAARLCSCLAAVFAKLPVALAVYWETADHFLSPETVVNMADKAVSDEWPVDQWIGANLGTDSSDRSGRDLKAGVTNGLRPFKGFELSLPAAPMELDAVYSFLMGTSLATLALGAEFTDGDTMGTDDNPDFKYKLRVAPAGTFSVPYDLLLVIHPEAAFDADAVLGPSASQPPPPDMDAIRNYAEGQGFFKRMLRGQRPQ